jgi:hypothetical protein
LNDERLRDIAARHNITVKEAKEGWRRGPFTLPDDYEIIPMPPDPGEVPAEYKYNLRNGQWEFDPEDNAPSEYMRQPTLMQA